MSMKIKYLLILFIIPFIKKPGLTFLKNNFFFILIIRYIRNFLESIIFFFIMSTLNIKKYKSFPI